MKIDDLVKQSGEWLKGTGPESDIVISSRVRLARNLIRFPFLTRSTLEDKKKIVELITEKIREAKISRNMLIILLEKAGKLDRLVLSERQLISKDLAEAKDSRAVAISKSENISLMVNEEDHLRIQVLKSGLELFEAWKEIDRIDDKLAGKLPLAFDPNLGYLTACPTNVGTGLRASVMLHLPALVMSKQIEKVINMVGKINLAVRGLYGEGTQALGDFYQISNQVTIGRSEVEIIEDLKAVVPNVINYERRARQALFEQNRYGLEDRIWRSYGMLRNARVISSEETMYLLSGLRLGINMNIIKDIEIGKVNELFIFTQPAHLQKIENKKLDPQKRDIARADFIRRQLGAI